MGGQLENPALASTQVGSISSIISCFSLITTDKNTIKRN